MAECLSQVQEAAESDDKSDGECSGGKQLQPLHRSHQQQCHTAHAYCSSRHQGSNSSIPASNILCSPRCSTAGCAVSAQQWVKHVAIVIAMFTTSRGARYSMLPPTVHGFTCMWAGIHALQAAHTSDCWLALTAAAFASLLPSAACCRGKAVVR